MNSTTQGPRAMAFDPQGVTNPQARSGYASDYPAARAAQRPDYSAYYRGGDERQVDNWTGAMPQRTSAGVDQIRYGAGAALTAAIAVLTALLGMIVTRGILHLPVLESSDQSHLLMYTLGTAGIAVGAAALYNAMLHVAPRPGAYYAAIAVLGTALAVAIPFTTGAALTTQIALALMNLAVAAVIGILVPLAAGNAAVTRQR